MSDKRKRRTQPKGTGRHKTRRPRPASLGPTALVEPVDLGTLQRVVARPDLACPDDILAFQRRYGNRAVRMHIARATRKIGHTGKQGDVSIQRMIVTGEGEHGEHDLAALSTIGVYLRQSPQETVTVMGQADYSGIPDTEQLLIVAHGSPDIVGNKTVQGLKSELQAAGRRLKTDHQYIGLASCNTAVPMKTFAGKLKREMRGYNQLRVRGVPGIAVTNLKTYEEMVETDDPEGVKELEKTRRIFGDDAILREINKELRREQNLKARAQAAISNRWVEHLYKRVAEIAERYPPKWHGKISKID